MILGWLICVMVVLYGVVMFALVVYVPFDGIPFLTYYSFIDFF